VTTRCLGVRPGYGNRHGHPEVNGLTGDCTPTKWYNANANWLLSLADVLVV
jgi:hypothetical protein